MYGGSSRAGNTLEGRQHPYVSKVVWHGKGQEGNDKMCKLSGPRRRQPKRGRRHRQRRFEGPAPTLFIVRSRASIALYCVGFIRTPSGSPSAMSSCAFQTKGSAGETIAFWMHVARGTGGSRVLSGAHFGPVMRTKANVFLLGGLNNFALPTPSENRPVQIVAMLGGRYICQTEKHH